MLLPKLPKRKKREKPRDARDKFVQQQRLRAIDERKQTQQELLQVERISRNAAHYLPCLAMHLSIRSGCHAQLMQQIASLLRKEQKLVPAYQRRFKDEDPRSVFYYRMLRRIGLPEVHARFAPWLLKSSQIQLNRWSSVLFARLEQAFYAQSEELTTLEKIMREHQAQYNAIMKAPASRATGNSGAKVQKMEPRE